ncbi:DnaJ-like protein subfamily C member [Ooceraea biroi]|uniref:DnaJ homolog subfamily C member 17 n=1 Tax=Ooceraea biroi TaxID=2015173 RepID=A0A026WPM9_OOCBI|nr:DnaJ-like protein subfamily C member [Ooceraea biroi]
MDPIMRLDLYKLLGVEYTASVAEVKKAYRKKALTCHPDKNPDNPRAAELFLELSQALEILTDFSARAAYDKVFTARKQAKKRIRVLDSKRQKFKEDLEAREEAYKRSIDPKSEENRLKAKIARLEKEGAKLVELENEKAFAQAQMQRKMCASTSASSAPNRFTQQPQMSDAEYAEYEAYVFAKLRRAEELKRRASIGVSSIPNIFTQLPKTDAQKYVLANRKREQERAEERKRLIQELEAQEQEET